ncbi:unnamed protein product [Coregonus sp. 'balchen']|nr:unnamed protein product [Coregonus sp. 'balchen']
MSDALLRWCVDQLHHNFGLEASEDIVQYILSIDNADEIAEYVGDLLQGTDGRKKQFIDELLDRWQRSQTLTPDSAGLFPMSSLSGTDAPDMSKDSQKKSKRKGRNKQEVMAVSQAVPEPEVVKTPIDLMKAQESGSSSSQKKKKNTFVSLYNKEGQDKLAILLPGRHSCECLAQKHNLINNCMICGRIVCEQEGSGPCIFCGTLVCTKEEQEILQRDSNKSQKLRKKLMEGASERDYLPHQEAKMKAGLEKALQHKDKLLEYDKNSTRRTQVLDDESDYFATDSNQFDETVKALNTGTKVKSPQRPEGPAGRQHLRELVNPNIVQAAPKWVDVGSGPRRSQDKGVVGTEGGGAACPERSRLRLQDKELQEMADGGWCLSMHQPWASLLVKGIKRSYVS